MNENEYAQLNSTQNAFAPKAERTVQDSIGAGHRFVGALGSILDGILSDLTGYGTDANTMAGAAPSSGIVGDANSLANRINDLISTAEQIKERLATPQVHDIAASLAKQQATMASMASPRKY